MTTQEASEICLPVGWETWERQFKQNYIYKEGRFTYDLFETEGTITPIVITASLYLGNGTLDDPDEFEIIGAETVHGIPIDTKTLNWIDVQIEFERELLHENTD